MITIAITRDFCAHLAGIIIPSVPFRREQIPSLRGCLVFLLPADLPSSVMAFAVSGANSGDSDKTKILLLK